MPRLLNVLVTRPEPGASRTARAIRQRGHHPHLLPLTQIHGLDPAMPDPGNVEALIATSANAIRFLPKAARRELAGKPLHLVGHMTAEQARRAGFRNIASISTDADGLLEAIARTVPSATLFLAGRVRRSAIEDAFARTVRTLEICEVYDTLPRLPTAQEVETLRSVSPDAVVLSSAFSARIFADISEQAGLASDAVRLCMSARIAEAAGGRCLVAAAKKESSILDLLDRIAEL